MAHIEFRERLVLFPSSSLGTRSSKLRFDALRLLQRHPLQLLRCDPTGLLNGNGGGKLSFQSVRSQAGAWERVGIERKPYSPLYDEVCPTSPSNGGTIYAIIRK